MVVTSYVSTEKAHPPKHFAVTSTRTKTHGSLWEDGEEGWSAVPLNLSHQGDSNSKELLRRKRSLSGSCGAATEVGTCI